MLSFLILFSVLCGVHGKAFLSRYKRNYEVGYRYIPFEQGRVQLQAGYSQENHPNYQDYINEYIRTKENDWSSYYYQPEPFQPLQGPFLINTPHNMKAKHTWHFIDKGSGNKYRDEKHRFDSSVEVPIVIEALIKKEVIDGNNEKYDIPIIVEALRRKDNEDSIDAEIPVIVDSLTAKENLIYENVENAVVTDSLIDKVDKFKEPDLDFLLDEQKTSAPYKPYKSVTIGSYDIPIIVEALTRKSNEDSIDAEIPIIVDSLTVKENLLNDEYVKKSEVTDSSIKYGDFDKLKGSNLDLITGEQKTVDSLTVKENLIYEKVKNAKVTNSLIEHKEVDKFKGPDIDFLLDEQKTSASYKPYESATIGSYDIPIIVEALTRKSNDEDSIDSEIPIIVDSLTVEGNLINCKWVKKSEVTDSLIEHGKVDKFKVPNLDLLTNERKTSSSHKPCEPVTIGPVDAHKVFELPVKMNSLKKKQTLSNHMYKPTKENAIQNKNFGSSNELDIKKSLVPKKAFLYAIPVTEASIRKAKPTALVEEEIQTPVAASVKKPTLYENEKINTKLNKIPPKRLLFSRSKAHFNYRGR